MNANISDDELQAKLTEYAIPYTEKDFLRKRDILVKKLNVKQSRERSEQAPRGRSPKKTSPNTSMNTSSRSRSGRRKKSVPTRSRSGSKENLSAFLSSTKPNQGRTTPASPTNTNKPREIASPSSKVSVDSTNKRKLLSPQWKPGGLQAQANLVRTTRPRNSVVNEDSFVDGINKRTNVSHVRSTPINSKADQNNRVGSFSKPKPPTSTICEGVNWLVMAIFLGVSIVVLSFFYLRYVNIPSNRWVGITDDSLSNDPKDHFNVCSKENSKSCYDRSSIKSLLKYLPKIEDTVENIAVAHYCGNKAVSKYMVISELGLPSEMGALLFSLVKLNPHWPLAFTNAAQTDDIPDRYDDVVYVYHCSPRLGLFCSIKVMVNTARMYAVYILTLLAFFSMGYLFLRNRFRNQNDHEKDVTRLVEQICSYVESVALAAEHDPGQLPYVPVLHVRDHILPCHRRAELADLWSEAELWIRQNESRIATALRKVDGSDCETWKWISTKSPVQLANSFEESPTRSNGRANAIPVRRLDPPKPVEKRHKWYVPPEIQRSLDNRQAIPQGLAPCLKIRGLTDVRKDSGPNWQRDITRSLLQRLSDIRGIHHIGFDEGSLEGVGYIKCKDNDVSGQVFQRLDGVFFDGRQLRAKYLFFNRYVDRFPDAAYACRDLTL